MRDDCSLRPSFWRTTAHRRAAPNAHACFGAAREASSEPRVERPKAAGTSGYQRRFPQPNCAAADHVRGSRGLRRRSRQAAREPLTPAVVLANDGAPFVALKTIRKPLSEPRVERPKAAGTSGYQRRFPQPNCAAADHVRGSRGLRRRSRQAAREPLTPAVVLANDGAPAHGSESAVPRFRERCRSCARSGNSLPPPSSALSPHRSGVAIPRAACPPRRPLATILDQFGPGCYSRKWTDLVLNC